ncbi:hypothetical protein GGS21DRAFT_542719 [Xylaria nigripes]|nr:hypothetical protein GGS21DRAFT_542719 [Xylaria nigripes]
MAETTQSRCPERSHTNETKSTEQSDRNGGGSEIGARAYQLRLWPPPCLQAYCLDHFMMECEIYHEQENDRYHKLVAHTREKFLADRNKKKPSKKPAQAPTRHQPPRQAKGKTSSQVPPPTKAPKPQRPPRPREPPNAPFKPARLEKAFKDSQAGSMVRILSSFHEKLDLHKSWEDYRPPLENKIREAENRQRAELKKGKKAHENCAFGGPLGMECRYCGFAGTVQCDDAVTPRKLAAPAAMHSIAPGDTQEWGVMFRGTNFFVDVCGAKTMIVLVDFRGVLDLCAELFGEQEAMPDSPTSLTARLGSIGSRPDDVKAVEAKRRLDELVSGVSDTGGGD